MRRKNNNKVFKSCWQINIRENRRGNQEWTIRRNWHHWLYKTQDEYKKTKDKQTKQKKRRKKKQKKTNKKNKKTKTKYKQNKKNTSQHVLDTTVHKQTQIT